MTDAPVTRPDLDAIEAREDFATPGPWHVEHGRIYAGDQSTPDTLALASMLGSRPWLADADFIAHAREDIPALLAALAAERARADQAEAVVAAVRDALYKLHQEKNTIKTSPGGIGYVRPTATKATPTPTGEQL